jgi:hypothetical protein
LSELLGAAAGEPVQDELSAVRLLFELLGFLLRRLPTGTLFTLQAQRHGEKHFFLSSVWLFAGIPAVLAVDSKAASLLQNLPPDTSADFHLELVRPKNNSQNL